MRHYLVAALFSFFLFGCGPGADAPPDDTVSTTEDVVAPPENRDANVAANEDAPAFFARFKSTVRANDAEAVANMAEFPFELSGIDRDQFLSEYYPTVFGDGEFRDRLLAGSPAALTDEGDGRFSFAAHVSDCGDTEEATDCESSVIFYFGQNAEGHWRLVDMMFAG